MSEKQNKQASSSAKKPVLPKSSSSKVQVQNSASNKSDSSKKQGSSSSKTNSCSNKLKNLSVNSIKSTSINPKPTSRSERSEKSAGTIDLTGDLKSKTSEEVDHKKIAEEIAKKDGFIRALQARVFNREPVQAITSLRGAIRDKFNTCKLIKPLHQTWQDHNCSPEHISYLLTNCGSYCKVTNQLQRNFLKELNLFCELCGNWYPDIISYSAHKFDTEHQNRTRDLSNWRQASRTAGTNLSEWKRVPKIKKVDAITLSKAIRKSIHKKKLDTLLQIVSTRKIVFSLIKIVSLICFKTKMANNQNEALL